MRVLIVSQYFWPENFLINLVVARLVAKGVSVTVLTGKPNYPNGKIFENYSLFGTQRESYCGAEIVRVPIIPRGKKGNAKLAINYLSFVVSASLLGPWLLRSRTFDAVLVYAPSPLLQAVVGIVLARIKRAPLLLWVQDLWPESIKASGFKSNSIIYNLLDFLVKWIYDSSDRILVQSRGFISSISEKISKINEIYYVPNTSPDETGGQRNRKSSSDITSDIKKGFSFVFAGNVGHAQGLDTLLEAVENLSGGPNFDLFIVGSGRLDEWLKAQVRERSLHNVHLVGRYPSAEMTEILEAASVLVVTLRSDPIFRLTIPNKLQSYLAAGRPILAVLEGEGAAIVEEAKAGVTCQPGDAASVAEAISRMRSIPERELKAMGSSGRQYYDKFFAPNVLINLLGNHLKEAILEHRRRPL